MQIPRPSEETKALFRSLVPEAPGVEVKPMFANLGAFVNGNMFAGLYGESVGVKLPEAARAEVLAAGGGPYGPEERPMGGYVSLPAAWMGDRERLSSWLEVALKEAALLPPKEKKPRGRAAGAR